MPFVDVKEAHARFSFKTVVWLGVEEKDLRKVHK
jgi:hypothetical protein